MNVRMGTCIRHCFVLPHAYLFTRIARDILDNGNGVVATGDGADAHQQRRLSYYRWLGIDPQEAKDEVWVQTAVNRIVALKSNVTYG
jgi:hypothetical protein